MKMLTSCFTTLVLCLLLTACGGDKPLFSFDGGNNGGGGGSQASAPAGVYTGTTTNLRQYLAVIVPDGSGNLQFNWWYTVPNNSLGTGNLDGFINGGLTATGNSSTGTFTVGSITDFYLSSGNTSAVSLSNNSYANGDIMGSLLQDSTTVSYDFSQVTTLPALTLSDLATGGPYAGSTLNLAGQSLGNLNMQIQSDGSFIAQDTGATCIFAGTLTATTVNSVFFVTIPPSAPTGSGNCMGAYATARSGVAIQYNGSVYMAVASVGGTTAGLFGPPG